LPTIAGLSHDLGPKLVALDTKSAREFLSVSAAALFSRIQKLDTDVR
jgi:hypothetical protein